MNEISIALVGIGGYGGGYTREILDRAAKHDARFVAAIDPYAAASPLFSEIQQAGVPIFATLDDFFTVGFADLVAISAPIHFHATLTCQALAQGSHVLCEKPLCATLDEAKQMLAAQADSGKIVSIGYQWSFSGAIQALKKDALTGLFGQPRQLKMLIFWPRDNAYYARNQWAGRVQTATGQMVYDSPVNNATAHFLHNAFFVLGDTLSTSDCPVGLQAEIYRVNPIENYDTAALRCQTKSSVEILFYTSHAVAEERGPMFEYIFEKAKIKYPVGAAGDIVATFEDGQTKNYGSPEGCQAHWSKIWQTVDAIQLGTTETACGIQAALPLTLCVNAIQDFAAIRDFPAALKETKATPGGTLSYAIGLMDVLDHCYENAILPSEIPTVSWAEPSTQIDLLERYSKFTSE